MNRQVEVFGPVAGAPHVSCLDRVERNRVPRIVSPHHHISNRITNTALPDSTARQMVATRGFGRR